MVAGLSLVPDLDVIPAIIFQGYARRITTIFRTACFLRFQLLSLIAGIFHRIYRSNFWLWFVISLISYDLHVIMDALTA